MTGPRTGTRRTRRRTVTRSRSQAGDGRYRADGSRGSGPAQPAAEGAPRRRRASVGGHALKLSAPAKPGFKRRFFNDDGNRLADAEELGYDHVSETGLKTSSPGSRVSRLVGTKANGEPLHAFLMETPDELYAQGEAEKEAACRTVDDAIRAGRDSTGQMSPTETYGQGSINSDR
jgi:hypothetical protein